MRRRDFITGLASTAATLPLGARAQQLATPVIGMLWPGQPPPGSPRMESFTQALRQLGFIEGQNVSIELRYAREGLQQLPKLAAELGSKLINFSASRIDPDSFWEGDRDHAQEFV